VPQADDENHVKGIRIEEVYRAIEDYKTRKLEGVVERIASLEKKRAIAGDAFTACKITDEIDTLKKELVEVPKYCKRILNSPHSRKRKLRFLGIAGK